MSQQLSSLYSWKQLGYGHLHLYNKMYWLVCDDSRLNTYQMIGTAYLEPRFVKVNLS